MKKIKIILIGIISIIGALNAATNNQDIKERQTRLMKAFEKLKSQTGILVTGRGKADFTAVKGKKAAASNTNAANSEIHPFLQMDISFIAKPTSYLKAGATLRFENDMRGFWGEKDMFSVRELYLETIIARTIKLRFGDIYAALTPYTLYIPGQLFAKKDFNPTLFNKYHEDELYQNFLDHERKRPLQGINISAGFDLKLSPVFLPNAVAIKLLGSKLELTSPASKYDKYLFGGTTQIYRSQIMKIGSSFILLKDFENTKILNPPKKPLTSFVWSANFKENILKNFKPKNDFSAGIKGEVALSKNTTEFSNYLSYGLNENGLNIYRGNAYKIESFWGMDKKQVKLDLAAGFHSVDDTFYSPGAQSRVYNNFNTPYLSNQPLENNYFFYNYTNKMDFLGNTYVPLEAAKPFGEATPNRVGVRAELKADLFDFAKAEISTVFDKEKYSSISSTATELRSFTVLDAGLQLSAKRFLKKIGMDASIDFRIIYERNSRFDDVSTPQDDTEDLTKTDIRIGIDYSPLKNFWILFGVKKIDQYVLANTEYDFYINDNLSKNPLEFNQTESISPNFKTAVYAVGLFYRFNKGSAIRSEFIFMNYENWNDATQNSDYGINSFNIFYELNF